jgi:hypothetical protein
MASVIFLNIFQSNGVFEMEADNKLKLVADRNWAAQKPGIPPVESLSALAAEFSPCVALYNLLRERGPASQGSITELFFRP